MLIIAGVLFASWVVVRRTHILEIYHIPTTSNQPTYKTGDMLIASKIKKPDTNSFIVFKGPYGSPWVFRCIAKEGDVIEIKNAVVYLNGKLLNEPYAWNEYYITKDQLQRIMGYVDKNKNTVKPINDSLFSIALTTSELKQYNLTLKPYAAPKDSINQGIFPEFKKIGYNEDNLGPIKIPKGCFFVLGDSRHDAYDSRYFGFVKEDEIISTAIKKR